MLSTHPKGVRSPETGATVLILSGDAIAAALLGALIETLGFAVKFAQPAEQTEQSIRRTRPKVCLIDCIDPSLCTDELLGRARMRGIAVVIFGTREALDRLRAVALEHDIDTLLMPTDAGVLDQTLHRALKKAG